MKRKNILLLHTRAQVYSIISILSSKCEQNPARGLGLHVLKHIPNLPPTNSLKRGAPILSHLFPFSPSGARLPRLVLLQSHALALQHREQRLRTLENLEIGRLSLLNGLVIITSRRNLGRGTARQHDIRGSAPRFHVVSAPTTCGVA